MTNKHIALIAALLLSLVATIKPQAQIRGNNIVVSVEPDHQDWNYQTGQTANFQIEVRRSGTLVSGVKATLEAGPEMYPEVTREVELKDGTLRWKGTMRQPGFYRVKVTAEVGGRKYEGLCTAAFSPEKLKASTTDPADFDQFWAKAIEEARHTPLEPTRTLLPERCTKDMDVYEVSFHNLRWGSRTYGILSVPKAPGRYPALLRVPGAGVRPYTGDTYTAPGRLITLEIGIHGVPVTMEQNVYDRLQDGALNGYWNYGLADRDQSYYKRVIVGCIRAIDYLQEFTPWDGTRLGVTGSSQGGFLSLATAALDKRVTCYGAVHAALCDHTNSLGGKACGWPHYFYWRLQGAGSQREKAIKDMQHEIETSRYYDGVNFARRISKAAGWFSFGYNDDVVPPTTAWATYNATPGPKQMSLYQQTGHYWYQEQWDEWLDWLRSQLLD